MASVQAFIGLLEEFLVELKDTFPEEKKIKVYYNSFKTMKKINPRAILEGFMAEATKRSDMIVNRNEAYFLDGNDEFMNELNVSKWWTSDLSSSTKDAIWQHINTLYVIGTTLTSVPTEVLSSIESVAEQFAGQMGADGAGMSGANMGNLMAGLQNMIGNMGNQRK